MNFVGFCWIFVGQGMLTCAYQKKPTVRNRQEDKDMKKGLGVIFTAAIVVAILSFISPDCRELFKKHIPVAGHEVVSMTSGLAGIGMDAAKIKAEDRETANRVVNDMSDIANAGLNYFATEDEACMKQATLAADDIILAGMDGLEKVIGELFAEY